VRSGRAGVWEWEGSAWLGPGQWPEPVATGERPRASARGGGTEGERRAAAIGSSADCSELVTEAD
jgi:hypothetical protein